MPYKNISIVTGIVMVVGLAAVAIFQYYEVHNLNARLNALENNAAGLQRDIAVVASSTIRLATTTQAQIDQLQAAAKKQAVLPKTQDQLITSAVAATAPAVVSIVISEDVPQLQVTYINPFGNDPKFKDLGIRVPVYQEKGSSLQKIGAGSGFLVSHDGYIVTNKHVVADQNAQYTVLLSTGVQKTATVVYRDQTYDIAVIKIVGSFPTIATLGDSSSLSLGQTVIAIGNALGEYNNSVSVGIISGLNRTIQASDANTGASEQLNNIIQTDAAINPGNSGGPLIDLKGSVVGINVATIVGSSNIAFAIPMATVRNIIQGVVR